MQMLQEPHLLEYLATLRVEPGYINFIEKMWDSFHYRAKEWILMIYELLWDYREDFHDNMLS